MRTKRKDLPSFHIFHFLLHRISLICLPTWLAYNLPPHSGSPTVATRSKSRRNRETAQQSSTTQETSATDRKPTKRRQERKRLPDDDDDDSDSMQMDVSKENNNTLEPTAKDSGSSTVTVIID